MTHFFPTALNPFLYQRCCLRLPTTHQGWKGKQRDPGDHSGGDTPLPIPNRAVKTANADGTTWETLWESRSSPGFSSKSLLDQRIGKALFICGGRRQTGDITGGRRAALPSFRVLTRARGEGVAHHVRAGIQNSRRGLHRRREILHFVQNDASDRSA